MIRGDRGLRRICAHYEQVENYAKAVADKEQVWHLHHRREIDEMKLAKQLKEEGKYYDVEPEELIFLTHSEHTRIHSENLSEASRKKISERAKERTGEKHSMFGKFHSEVTRKKMSKSQKGENNPMFGKHHSEATKKKISEAQNGKHHSEAAKKKMSESHKGKETVTGMFWWNNGIIAKLSKEQPGPDFVRGRLK